MGAIMFSVYLAKTIADLTFGQALAYYVVKYAVSAVVALAAIGLGIRLRKNKNAKMEHGE